jgi:hypothetical protein
MDVGSHADPRLRGDARGGDGGVREKLADGISVRLPMQVALITPRSGGIRAIVLTIRPHISASMSLTRSSVL